MYTNVFVFMKLYFYNSNSKRKKKMLMFLNIELGFNKTQSSERESGFAVIHSNYAPPIHLLDPWSP